MESNAEFTFAVVTTDAVPTATFADVRRLFRENYREANLAYLEKNLSKLRYLATAVAASGEVAGFALGEARIIDLPGAPGSNVHLAGLCCVGTEYRRHGLFRKLEGLALGANELPRKERWLSCGRTAHPASFRGFFADPAAVPHAGRVPNAWQRDVGSAIAEAYGSPGFDRETFVIRGGGTPIGWPVIEIEATAEEWAMFEPVDRAKGDSLLGIAWHPTAPAGWLG
ncbi:MAG: hypothetical protein ABIP13_10840 [Tepidiformaceae bacterium]